MPDELGAIVDRIISSAPVALRWLSPNVVGPTGIRRRLGVIHLKDIVKQGMRRAVR